MKLEGVDTRSEMVNIQKLLQRNSNSFPLIPPCPFDLEWYRDCKCKASLALKNPNDFVLEEKVLQEHARLKTMTAIIIKQKQAHRAEVQKDSNN